MARRKRKRRKGRRKKRGRRKRRKKSKRRKRSKRRSRKFPKNPKKGQRVTIVRRGRRITFEATGKKGFGAWKIVSNVPA